MSANAFTYLFSFFLRLCSPVHGKHFFAPSQHLPGRLFAQIFYCFVFVSPERIHAKSSGSNTCFAWDSPCSLTNCAGMEMLQDNKRVPGPWLDGNRKYYHTEGEFSGQTHSLFSQLSVGAGTGKLLQRSCQALMCLLVMLKWNFWAVGTVVWALAVIVKRRKRETKSQDGKRWRQVWFRGTRLCRVRRSLCLTACFQYSWWLCWEHSFRGKVFKGVWSHLASWHVLVKDKCLLLIRLGPASWSRSSLSGHC